jgi:hypothetical protein
MPTENTEGWLERDGWKHSPVWKPRMEMRKIKEKWIEPWKTVVTVFFEGCQGSHSQF